MIYKENKSNTQTKNSNQKKTLKKKLFKLIQITKNSKIKIF